MSDYEGSDRSEAAERVEIENYFATQRFQFWTRKEEGGEPWAHLCSSIRVKESSNNLTIECNCSKEITIYYKENGKRFDMNRWIKHKKECVMDPKKNMKRKSTRLEEKLNEGSEVKRIRLDDNIEYETADDEEEYNTADEESLDDKIAECFKIYYSEGIYYCYDKERGKIIFSIVFCIFY